MSEKNYEFIDIKRIEPETKSLNVRKVNFSEIYEQTNGQVDAFIMGAGTGGTISGVGTYLKEKKGEGGVKIILADPTGSVLPQHCAFPSIDPGANSSLVIYGAVLLNISNCALLIDGVFTAPREL